MYRLGDTVRVPIEAEFKALSPEEMDQQLRDTLIAWSEGRTPEWACEQYEYLVLTTKAMVDDHNQRDFGKLTSA